MRGQPLSPFAGGGGTRSDQVDPDYLYLLEHIFDSRADSASPPDGEPQGASAPTPGGRAGTSSRPKEEVNPPADLPWPESEPHMDEDYREFFRNLRFEKGRMVLKVGGESVSYQLEEAWSGRSSKAEDGEEEEAASAADSAAGEEEEEYEGKKVAPISSDGRVQDVPEPHVRRDCRARALRKRKTRDDEVRSDGKMVAVSEPDSCDSHADPRLGKRIKVEKQLLEAPVQEKVNAVNREVYSSNGRDTRPHVAALESYGVVWPIHILERPDSDFKERLMHVLREPVSQREYDNLTSMATANKPVVKERRTRRGVKSYYSDRDMGKSYFDSYPDLAEQVANASYPNQIALLRGFFFWLKNIGHEDQFRPWADDHTHYEIIPFMDGDSH